MERKLDSETKNGYAALGKAKGSEQFPCIQRRYLTASWIVQILYLMIVLAEVHALDRVCYVSKAGLELMTSCVSFPVLVLSPVHLFLTGIYIWLSFTNQKPQDVIRQHLKPACCSHHCIHNMPSFMIKTGSCFMTTEVYVTTSLLFWKILSRVIGMCSQVMAIHI